MKNTGWTIFLDSDQTNIGYRQENVFHVSPVSISFQDTYSSEEDEDNQPSVEEKVTRHVDAITSELKDVGYRGEEVLLAMGSSFCLSATQSMENLSQYRQRSILLYDLEQWLPVAAEDYTADFVMHKKEAFGVAVVTADWRLLVDRLERQGITIRSISPTALIAIQKYSGQQDHANTKSSEKSTSSHASTLPKNTQENQIVILEKDGFLDMVWLHGRKPIRWRHFLTSAKFLRAEIDAALLEFHASYTMIPVSLSEEMLHTLQQIPNVTLVTQNHSSKILELVIESSEEVASGKFCPWIELRRDALVTGDRYRFIRGPLGVLYSGVLIFLLALSAALWLQTQNYDAQIAKYCQKQEQLFHKVFPKQQPPRGIVSRLESEKLKIVGLSDNDKNELKTPSSLLILYEFLVSLPTDTRFRILELGFIDGRIEIDSEVRSHGDATKLTTVMQSVGFDIEPPKTQQVNKRVVSARIFGRYEEKAERTSINRANTTTKRK